MTSIFTEKSIQPDDAALKIALGNTYSFWKDLEAFTISTCPESKGAWNYSGQKFGWSYRIKDHKRVLIYLLPRDRFFKVAFVFSQKATEAIMENKISPVVKDALNSAIKHVEGRGFRLNVTDKKNIPDIKKLVLIKVAF